MPNLLSIAGSDPSGGAGIQADLKTFSALGCYGMAAMTALTAQNTRGVSGVIELPHDFVMAQMEAIFKDIPVHAMKIGMAGSVQTISVISELIQRFKIQNVVLDTVMVATSGDRLLSDESVKVMRRELVPMAKIITPNIPEAEMLVGKTLSTDLHHDMEALAKGLIDIGARAALLKGGHLHGPHSIDYFIDETGHIEKLKAERIRTQNTHGTGCTLSSAIACYLAKGLPLLDACVAAKKYLTHAIEHADHLKIGKGSGPVHHFYNFWD